MPLSRSATASRPQTADAARTAAAVLGPSSKSGAPPGQHPPVPSLDVNTANVHARPKRGMTGILDLDRGHNRRDRTFAGGECVVCDEPLEHMLKGEKILQLACADVSHEACFYEYIKDTDSLICPACHQPLALDSNRGGNVIDVEKLSSIVRALQVSEKDESISTDPPVPSTPYGAGQSSHHAWNEAANPYSRPGEVHHELHDDSMMSKRMDYSPDAYTRHVSDVTSGTTLGRNISLAQSGASAHRRYEWDMHSMEAAAASPRLHTTKAITPAPTVSIRSEYPTITRSGQQQTLTCLVTVEVPQASWTGKPGQSATMPPPPQPPQELPSQGPPSIEGSGMPPHSLRVPSYQQGPPSVADSSHRREFSAAPTAPMEDFSEIDEELDRMSEELKNRVDNWHGLDFDRFGKLKQHSTLRVGKDKQSWQELECYLFTEMLICVKEKKSSGHRASVTSDGVPAPRRFTLKGSIMIRRHLERIEHDPDNKLLLTLCLSVIELPSFHLLFESKNQLQVWRDALFSVNQADDFVKSSEYDGEVRNDDEVTTLHNVEGPRSSGRSSQDVGGASGPIEYSELLPAQISPLAMHMHVPIDIVMVIPVTSSMHGLKISLLRDMLRFVVFSLGERDRMGLVTTGSTGGAVPLVGMASKNWSGWGKSIDAVGAFGPRDAYSDAVDGANCAMDLLMQRKQTNPISSILLVSDLSTPETDGVDFVVSRAEAARVSIYSFGLGIAHKPDAIIDMSSRTKAAYTYVKDWMVLRECVAGVLGSLQSVSHQNVALKLRLPEDSPGKFAKISGALQVAKRSSGRECEAYMGDLRFGEKRDVLVTLIIEPELMNGEQLPQDAWDSVVAGLEALGGPVERELSRPLSVEEAPVLQADLMFNDVFMGGIVKHSPMPSLLNIMILPGANKQQQKVDPPMPPNPQVVQRRMELLASDMLTRALTLVARGQHERAQRLLLETRSILKGLGKGGLPPLPLQSPNTEIGPNSAIPNGTANLTSPVPTELGDRFPPPASPSMSAAASFFPGASGGLHGIDTKVMEALDIEIENALEWILQPTVFNRDSRKAVLQSIGVINSQRAYTSRSPLEAIWSARVAGIKALLESSQNWRENGNEALLEAEA